jgi:hypothetical protein
LTSAVSADKLEVLSSDSEDIHKVELAEGELGDLTVYLKSLGDELNGYTVSVIDDLDRQVASEVSTAVGIVRFTGIPAGRFRVKVEIKRSVRGVKIPVTVGDIKLKTIPGIIRR